MVRGTQGPLARLFEQGSVVGMTDGQLLDRFTTRRGDAAEAAFEALVARHGPMVARVCRNCLRDEHDVEDAFQATFLVLVRRAGAIGERDLLGPWLYGVAHRVARKARAVAAKRRGREGASAEVDPPARGDGSVAFEVDLGPVLHEEVDRLPAKYRQPVILCHLQGLTHAQAAQELAWPVGTVSVRLARARKLLADRLARRGVTASVTAIAATLTAEATAATLAPSWAHAAAIAALTAATGLPLTTATAAISAGAVPLARRTSMTLLLSSWKWLTIPAAVALTTATGAALVGSTNDNDQPKPSPAQVATVPPPSQRDPTQPSKKVTRQKFSSSESTEVDGRVGLVTSEGDNIAVEGQFGDLDATLKQLQGTDPKATFELRLSGKIQYQGDLMGDKEPEPTSKPTSKDNEKPLIVALPDGRYDLGTPPPGYFDLPAPKPGTPGAPQPVRIGQTLQVEALEALPGRPINGERVVRTDGTISLGFYGDLYVVGLNRDQIKVKLVEHLRKYLSDSVLGLTGFKDGKPVAIAPVAVNRVFIDDQPGPTSTTTPAPQPNQKPALTASPRPVSGSVPVKVGQTLVIEVLEALPGRPINGERVVRPDGTVGLGFYGDVAVAGLTRDQIKVKVIDHLRKYLSDEALGLRLTNDDTDPVKTWTVPPLQSDRVFVADDVDFDWSTATPPPPDGKVQVGQILAIEVLHALPGRPISGQRIVQPDGTVNLGFYGSLPVVGLTRDQIKVAVIDLLRTKVSADQLGLVKEDAQGEKRPVAPVDSASVFVDDAVPRPTPRAADQVRKLSEQVTDLSGKLDAALGAIERLRRDRPRDAFGPPRR